MPEDIKGIGEKIKELRFRKGMSQQELADRVDVGKTTISNYEIGYSIPSYETLSKIAEELDATVEYFSDISEEDNLNDNHMYFSRSTKIPIFEPAEYEKIMNNDLSKVKEYLEVPNCLNVRSGYFLALTSHDNNMDNCKIEKGDYVIVKRFELNNGAEELFNQIENGKIYAFELDGKVYIRKLFKNRDLLTIASDSFANSERPFNVAYDEVKIIGECIKALVNL